MTDSLVVALKEPIQAIQQTEPWRYWLSLLVPLFSAISAGISAFVAFRVFRMQREAARKAISNKQDSINGARIMKGIIGVSVLHNISTDRLRMQLQEERKRDVPPVPDFKIKYVRPLSVFVWEPGFTNPRMQAAWEKVQEEIKPFLNVAKSKLKELGIPISPEIANQTETEKIHKILGDFLEVEQAELGGVHPMAHGIEDYESL